MLRLAAAISILVLLGDGIAYVASHWNKPDFTFAIDGVSCHVLLHHGQIDISFEPKVQTLFLDSFKESSHQREALAIVVENRKICNYFHENMVYSAANHPYRVSLKIRNDALLSKLERMGFHPTLDLPEIHGGLATINSAMFEIPVSSISVDSEGKAILRKSPPTFIATVYGSSFRRFFAILARVALIFPALLAIRSSRSMIRSMVGHSRRRRNVCIACGYDLRCSDDRCPECGLAKEEAT